MEIATDDGSEGRKAKRELSQSKRAAQNRAAQVSGARVARQISSFYAWHDRSPLQNPCDFAAVVVWHKTRLPGPPLITTKPW